MTWWQAAILGLLQGLTEFLPVSSSGHLVLAQHILGLQLTPDVTFEVFLHAGTALSILIVYRDRLGVILSGFFRTLMHPQKSYQDNPHARFTWQIIFASIPAGLAYIFLDTQLEWTYARPWFACVMLILTGIFLASTLLARSEGGEMTLQKSILMGIAQAVSLLPGMSRSGATISTGLLSGIKPETAADFSFMMVLPAITGATMIKGIGLIQSTETINWFPVLLGTAIAFVTGIFAIHAVLGFVRRGRLHIFAFYCVGMGILGLFFL